MICIQKENIVKLKTGIKLILSLPVITLWILSPVFVTIGFPIIWGYIWKQFEPMQIIEVPREPCVIRLLEGGWLFSKRFVIANPPTDLYELKKVIEEYDQKNPINFEIVERLLENEKKIKNKNGVQIYTEEQKENNRLLLLYEFYKESAATPKKWNGEYDQDFQPGEYKPIAIILWEKGTEKLKGYRIYSYDEYSYIDQEVIFYEDGRIEEFDRKKSDGKSMGYRQ